MKKDQQDQAVLLRQNGYSVKQIEQKLNVSRSSVSRWVRHVELNDAQKISLKENSRLGSLISGEISKRKSQEIIQSCKEFGRNKVQKDRDFAVICALYWGEGNKTSYCTRLCNSDYKLIDVFVRWLVENKYEFSANIQYHIENSISYEEIEAWWLSKICHLNKIQFTKPSICVINRASQRKNIGKLPYGTIGITVKKSSKLFWMIMGGIEGLYENTFIC